MSDDRLLTVEDVARYLQMPVDFVQTEVEASRIDTVLIGGQVRIEQASVDRFVRGQSAADRSIQEESPVDRFLRGRTPSSSATPADRDSQVQTPSSSQVRTAAGGSASIILQRIGAGILIFFGILYVGYVIRIEADAGAFDGGLFRGIAIVLLALVFSAAWILPIGVGWMAATTASKGQKLRKQDYAYIQLSADQERILAKSLHPAQMEDARMRVRKIMAQQHLEKYGTLPSK